MTNKQKSTTTNPLGTDGFEFIEFAAPDPDKLAQDFEKMGFKPVATHKSKQVILYRQGQVNFILNREPDSFAQRFANKHGPAVCAMAFRVKDAQKAHDIALEKGAHHYTGPIGPGELPIPAVFGIGSSLLYFVDQYEENTIYDTDFEFFRDPKTADNYHSAGLSYIDHVTHNVFRGHMDHWADFYERIFNFREIRFFDIKGEQTGLISRALTSPCGKIRIPINESTDDKSQIEEYLQEYKGEGIQHIALGSDDIYRTIEIMRQQQIDFLEVPDTYYAMVAERIPDYQEDLSRMQQNRILIDGSMDPKVGLLLQIFTKNMLGPVFFEIIQRKGNEGFGEGNFQALFDAIERDQKARGVL